MTIPWEKTLSKLPAEEQSAIVAHSHDMIAEYVGLKELRKARRMSQVALAQKLHTDQAGVSKLEKRADLLLSTLKGYVEAAGGSLEIVARFPDSPPMRIDQLGQAGRPKRVGAA
ncbi:MAG: helix-turn-helix domain-containing protein [Beijerinckiaceae bacterium]